MSSMQAAKSMPKSMNSQIMPSFLYSSCSRTNMVWLKNCCSFSLVKLMHSCSMLLYWRKEQDHLLLLNVTQFAIKRDKQKILTSKISKPAISSTPM